MLSRDVGKMKLKKGERERWKKTIKLDEYEVQVGKDKLLLREEGLLKRRPPPYEKENFLCRIFEFSRKKVRCFRSLGAQVQEAEDTRSEDRWWQRRKKYYGRFRTGFPFSSLFSLPTSAVLPWKIIQTDELNENQVGNLWLKQLEKRENDVRAICKIKSQGWKNKRNLPGKK
ncbi:hypothetical protein RUM43_001168 [Polyplax serrata]|uniref:Uncharacterized protein n=1 Tax=Polyplax serrata TaxID=468196 RepID=A0AAN8XTF5_POLSC